MLIIFGKPYKNHEQMVSYNCHSESCMLFIVAEVTKEALVYASIEGLVNTDTDEVLHGSGSLKQSKKGFDTDFAHTVKSRASESELISHVAAYRSDI